MQLTDQYRPSEWSEVIGQSAALRKIDALRRRGLGGRAFFVSGQSGTGKTTIARLIAEEVAGTHPGNIDERNAKELGVPDIKAMDRALHFYGMGDKHGRSVILNEVHGLTPSCVTELLTLTDSGEIPSHAIWVFTTTSSGQKKLFSGIDAHPLLSRCVELELSVEPAMFARRCREIAQAEGLDGKPFEDYLALARDCGGNFRQMLQRIESGAMLG